MKIVILDGICENPGDLSWDGFVSLGQLTVYDRTPDDPATIISRIADNQAVIVNKVKITDDIMAACPDIQYIGLLATGYDVIDIEAAKKRNIIVCNVSDYGTDAVAQHVFALLLAICNQVCPLSMAVFDGKWTNCPDFCFWERPLRAIKSKVIGIIGFGKIGRKVAEIAKAFNMHVLAYDVRPDVQNEYGHMVGMDTLLKYADIVTLHCPLNENTAEIINKKTIKNMRDGVMIINSSRGGLVNERDLADALKSGKVAFAAVDVVSSEPISADNPLLTCDNCIITPHIAWAARESRKILMEIAVENLKSFIEGEPINVVNF